MLNFHGVEINTDGLAVDLLNLMSEEPDVFLAPLTVGMIHQQIIDNLRIAAGQQFDTLASKSRVLIEQFKEWGCDHLVEDATKRYDEKRAEFVRLIEQETVKAIYREASKRGIMKV